LATTQLVPLASPGRVWFVASAPPPPQRTPVTSITILPCTTPDHWRTEVEEATRSLPRSSPARSLELIDTRHSPQIAARDIQ
jgi:hypothetical protein